MARLLRGVVWGLRPLGKLPDLPNGYVRQLDRERVRVTVWAPDGKGQEIDLDRRTAALVARRIIECLEATR